MIVDNPIITDLALGVDRRIPQAGDAQLIVPATAIPTLPLTGISKLVGQGPIGVIATSAIGSNSRFQPPSTAENNQNLFTLPKGYWRLQCTVSVTFDFAPAGGAVGCMLLITDGVLTVPLYDIVPRITSFSFFFTVSFLNRENWTFTQRTGVTAAGQNIEHRINYTINRLL